MNTQKYPATLIFFLFILIITVAIPHQSHAENKTYKLKFQGVYPPAHLNIKKVVFPWIEEIKKQSNGRLIIEYYPPNAIVKDKESYTAVEYGILDILAYAQGRNPGKFPLADILELPFLFPNSEVGSQVAWELNKKYPVWGKEYKGTKILWHWVSATAQMITTKKPVHNLSDLKGLKIIGWSPNLQAVPKTLGANGINIPPMDTYMALERGVADGVHASYAAIGPFKLAETASYVTESNSMVVPFYCVINKRTYKRLPKDLQNLLNDTTGLKMSKKAGKSLDEGANLGLEAVIKKGIKRITLTPAEYQVWKKRTLPLRETWITTMEKKGYRNIRDMLKDIELLTEKYMSN